METDASSCCTAAMCNGRNHLRSLEAVMVDLRAVRRLTRRVAFVDTNLYNDREHLKDIFLLADC